MSRRSGSSSKTFIVQDSPSLKKCNSQQTKDYLWCFFEPSADHIVCLSQVVVMTHVTRRLNSLPSDSHRRAHRQSWQKDSHGIQTITAQWQSQHTDNHARSMFWQATPPLSRRSPENWPKQTDPYCTFQCYDLCYYYYIIILRWTNRLS